MDEEKEIVTTETEDQDFKEAMELAKKYDEESGGNNGIVVAVVAGAAVVTGLALLARKAWRKHKDKKQAELDGVEIVDLEEDEVEENEEESEPEDNEKKK